MSGFFSKSDIVVVALVVALYVKWIIDLLKNIHTGCSENIWSVAGEGGGDWVYSIDESVLFSDLQMLAGMGYVRIPPAYRPGQNVCYSQMYVHFVCHSIYLFCWG